MNVGFQLLGSSFTTRFQISGEYGQFGTIMAIHDSVC